MPLTGKPAKGRKFSGCNSDRSEEGAKLDLELLADFLNFPYGEQGDKSSEKKDPLSRLKRLHPFREAFEFDSAWKDMKTVADLQKELLQVLDPLIGPPDKAKRGVQRLKNERLVKNHLTKLVAKINSLDLKFHWIVGPADEERRVPYFDPMTRKPIPNTERKIPSPWKKSGHAIFEIRQTRWIVTKSIVNQWSPNIQSARKLLFGIVALSLENRELSDLRKCGFCQKFFVSSDDRSNYCTADHHRLHARREAKINMRQRRADEKRRKEEERRESQERAERHSKESQLLIPLKSLLKRNKLPMHFLGKVRNWKKNGRQAKEILESLSAEQLNELAKDLLGEPQ
jgi:hypothetical protein